MASNSSVQIGIIPEFCADTDDWTVYKEILEEFFQANGVPESNKVSVLISVIGSETYRILRNLCHPNSPRDQQYDQLCVLLSKQFIPEIAVFRERAKFYRAEQQRGEDVKSWFARLKMLSISCKFGEQLDSLLLDKFIVGLTPGPVQDRLCEENEHLTLKEAVDLAANRESALQDADMAEDLGELSLDDHRRRRKRGRHGHHHRPESRFGYEVDFGHGPHHRHHHRHHPHHFGPMGGRHGPPPPHFGPMGRHGPPPPHQFGHMGHFGPPAHGFGGMGFGPMDRRGPPPPPDFSGCRGRGIKRWMKKWHKYARRSRSSSSSSSSSSCSSSSSSSSNSSSDEGVKRRKHYKKHKKGHRHGKFGHKQCHRKRQALQLVDLTDQEVTETTEPEQVKKGHRCRGRRHPSKDKTAKATPAEPLVAVNSEPEMLE
ncbi:uncharacterized protein LOC131435119 [Malaya genurostris]|uniref:uncharacterized protein LOC131435119 n=1 Tax=Malaya genurostris TaxID=325434 RepID=UPI0026F3C492|nr:uncharacterized protein LOC131435119 [Malaya genurostris]